jgi:energy-coupling factor transport system substrate-specific component
MKKWKTWQIVLFAAMCICLNVGGRLLSVRLELPLWADSFGTALCAYIAGPVCGAMVGLAGNVAYSVVNHLSAAYAITSIALGIIVGIAARRNWFDQFYGFMKAASLVMLTALVVSVPLNLLFSAGYTGNKWGDGVVNFLLDKEWPPLLCYILGQLALEFVDKVIVIAAVYLVILIRRWRGNRSDAGTAHRFGTGAAAVILCLSLGLSLSAPARAAGSSDPIDYNDYVQSVYSSSNGLPCGEANSIAQTNDGVLWIGTYAGLYRYNGREFRCVDNY